MGVGHGFLITESQKMQNVHLSMICKIFSTDNLSSSCINCKIAGNRVQYLSFYVNSASNGHSTNGHDGAMNIHAWYCATRDQNKMRAWTYIHIFKCIWTITASFPGPAQLSIACSMETWGEPGNETRTEQKPLRKTGRDATDSWFPDPWS